MMQSLNLLSTPSCIFQHYCYYCRLRSHYFWGAFHQCHLKVKSGHSVSLKSQSEHKTWRFWSTNKLKDHFIHCVYVTYLRGHYLKSSAATSEDERNINQAQQEAHVDHSRVTSSLWDLTEHGNGRPCPTSAVRIKVGQHKTQGGKPCFVFLASSL